MSKRQWDILPREGAKEKRVENFHLNKQTKQNNLLFRMETEPKLLDLPDKPFSGMGAGEASLGLQPLW